MGNAVVKVARNELFDLSYRIHLLFPKKNYYQVMSIGETIHRVKEEQLSLIRFGDGELAIIRGRNAAFQEANKELAEKLKEVLMFNDEGLLIAVNDIFGSLFMYRKLSRTFWKEHLFFYRKYYKMYLNKDRLYANAFFSRGYLTLEDRSNSGKWFSEIRDIWKNKTVLLVEGCTSQNGIGNDLFDEVREIHRVWCKGKNCYQDYHKIKAICLKEAQYVEVVLLSIGATAKPLALELYLSGNRVIDIGNLNLEYQAFLDGIKEKRQSFISGEEKVMIDSVIMKQIVADFS